MRLSNSQGMRRSGPCTIAVALGGGGARGLAHLGVLDVLRSEGVQPTFVSGTSMGGLVGALSAVCTDPSDMLAIARGFRFPGRFVPGRLLVWEKIFPSAAVLLHGKNFEDLATPLAVSAVDLITGEEIALHSGPLLPAVRATCAVPGVFVPERIGSYCLVDGGVTNMLPVDLAWACDPDVVIAVNIVASPPLTFGMDSRYARLATALGHLVPNPVTAHFAYEVAMRAVEIALDRQRAMAVAMTGPEVLIDVELSHVAISDFHRIDDIVEAGRQATLRALPRLRQAVLMSAEATAGPAAAALHIDPVCRMTVSARRARATVERDGEVYYFCSLSCRDTFVLHCERYETGAVTRSPIMRPR
jgi:NTE family protein